MDADGYVRIVDRTRDVIIVSGFNVFLQRGRRGAGLPPRRR